MIETGTWWLSSKTDPRWNVSGRGQVGGFEMPADCAEKLKGLLEELGQPPDDLHWHYEKDYVELLDSSKHDR